MNENIVTMTTQEVKPVEKIKAINPVITVNTSKTDKPCYSIQYYDLADNTWHIGYSSFNLDYVREWLAEHFEPIKADVQPVRHGRWITWKDKFPGKVPKKKNNLGVFCSECKLHADNKSAFCPHCGAKMDQEDNPLTYTRSETNSQERS